MKKRERERPKTGAVEHFFNVSPGDHSSRSMNSFFHEVILFIVVLHISLVSFLRQSH